MAVVVYEDGSYMFTKRWILALHIVLIKMTLKSSWP